MRFSLPLQTTLNLPEFVSIAERASYLALQAVIIKDFTPLYILPYLSSVMNFLGVADNLNHTKKVDFFGHLVRKIVLSLSNDSCINQGFRVELGLKEAVESYYGYNSYISC